MEIYAFAAVAGRGTRSGGAEGSFPASQVPPPDETHRPDTMAFLLSALVLLALLAGSVTITALRAPHWRQVAVERRRSWRERTGHGEPDADNGSAHEDGWDDPGDDGSGDAHVRGAASFSSARA